MSWFRRISVTALILCLCVVVFGAYVRLSDAGLGCPDWPGCYGHIGVPAADHEVSRAEARFPERPVEAHKAWKEMIHRYLASTLGLLIVAMAFLSLRRRSADGEPAPPRLLPWALVALVIFQGILGMWTVTWQLKPLVVTAHLLGGMATFSLLLWLWWSVRPLAAVAVASERRREHRSERQLAVANEREQGLAVAAASAAPPRLRLFAGIALVLLIGQIFLGGWTSTNYAALACPDLPTCHGSFWPETDIPTAFTLWHGLGINYEYGILDARARVTIHHFHRVGAVVLSAALLLLGAWLLRKGGAPLWRRFGIAVLAALSLQLLIGVSIVMLQLPLLLAAAHNAGAAILLAVLVSLNYHAWAASRSRS
jgi:cytochrome c oxidase assembly protein subunit 15